MEREWRLPLSSDSCPVPSGATSPIVLQPLSSGALPLHTLPKGATASFAHLGFYEVISVRRTELRGAWWSPFSNPLSPSALFPVSLLWLHPQGGSFSFRSSILAPSQHCCHKYFLCTYYVLGTLPSEVTEHSTGQGGLSQRQKQSLPG